MRRVIVDTGPLVALLDKADRRHAWARETVGGIRHPLYTCEAVITEASHIVRRVPGGRRAIMDLLAGGVVALAFRMDAELRELRSLVERYATVPMSIADACLVRMSELLPDASVLTFDSDFRVYRRAGRHAIPVIMPGRRTSRGNA